MGATESAVGYHTAVMVATEAIDRLQPTAASHDRVMILEVMGRDSGQIALAAGIAGGADVILVPEIPYNIDVVAAHISKLRHGTHNFAIVVVAEGVRNNTGAHVERRHALGNVTYGGIGHVLGETIAQMTGAETRVTVLGHVQRGGQPTWDDRLVASAFGVQAVDLIAEGKIRPPGRLAEPPRSGRAADGCIRAGAADGVRRHAVTHRPRPGHLPRRPGGIARPIGFGSVLFADDPTAAKPGLQPVGRIPPRVSPRTNAAPAATLHAQIESINTDYTEKQIKAADYTDPRPGRA